MENIILKAIKPGQGAKGKYWSIEYNGNRTASIAAWDKDVGEYIEKIGVGGSVDVEIKVNGEYTNIVAVDLTTGKKNEAPQAEEKQTSMLDDRSRSIIAQCLTKVWGEITSIGGTAEDVLTAYNYFLEKL